MSAKPYSRDLSNLDRKLLKAFGRGRHASEMEMLRSENPHHPSGAPYAAWDCGWCDAEELYTVPEGRSS
jgi:hypothetical protein